MAMTFQIQKNQTNIVDLSSAILHTASGGEIFTFHRENVDAPYALGIINQTLDVIESIDTLSIYKPYPQRLCID